MGGANIVQRMSFSLYVSLYVVELDLFIYLFNYFILFYFILFYFILLFF